MFIDKEPLLPPEVTRIEPALEDGIIRVMTRGVLGFSQRHPVWYGLIGFILGGGFVGVFVFTTYLRWTLFGIDVDFATALYQLVGGGVGGGVVGVALFFLYARSLRDLAGRSGV
jgi:hypothetical protein